MKKVIVLVLSLSILGSTYLVYNSLNKEEIPIKEETLDKEFISYTLNGSVTDKSYDTLISDYAVNSITCENGSIAEWNDTDKTIKLSSINVPDYCTIDFIEIPTLAEAMLRDNPTISERTAFGGNCSTTTGIIYKTNMTEDGNYVYYYSGNTENNWVLFGGYYWRIIRTNEDGSVRLLYAGTSHNALGVLSFSAFAVDAKSTLYAGYMYGENTSLADNRSNTTSSTIKGVIDTWYQNNLLTSFDKYISKTAIYCNDISIGEGTWTNTGSSFSYGANIRLNQNRVPSYKCGSNSNNELFESTQAVEDKFSASTTGGGNGQLTYPIALMTADEIAFAGGVQSTDLYSPYAFIIQIAKVNVVAKLGLCRLVRGQVGYIFMLLVKTLVLYALKQLVLILNISAQ